MTEQLREIKKLLSRRLKKDRYEHTIGVMYTAAALAMNYGEEIQAALTAGLLHDCGKYCSAEEQIQLCRKKNIALSDAEEQMPALVHAKLGVYLAEHEYGITDQSVLDAIRWHTTGRPDMTLLEKIIYIADYIEPNRKLIPGLPEVRKLAFQSIDDAICLCSKNTVEYLRETGKPVDPMSIETYNFYDASTEQSVGHQSRGLLTPTSFYCKKENNMNQAKEMARIAYEALSEKKGEDIKVIDISGISVLADYFLIAHGNSDSQVNALVENVEEQLHKAGYPLKEREGQASGKWVLMDFGDVIIHVFDRENRLFYNLERIWKDGKEIPAEEL